MYSFRGVGVGKWASSLSGIQYKDLRFWPIDSTRIEFDKQNRCDSCGNEEFYVLIIGPYKKIRLCKDCMVELIEKTNEFIEEIKK